MVKKILIVDDEVDLLNMFEIVLKKEGYEVYKAKNGKEALEHAQKSKIGLVVLDYYLPDINGQEVFNKIRQSEEGKDLPVIFVSASEEKLKEVTGENISEKFVKPVMPQDLRDAAKKHLAEENDQ